MKSTSSRQIGGVSSPDKAWRSRRARAGQEPPPAVCAARPALRAAPVRPPHRYALLRKSKERQAVDGLSNLNYFANVTYDALYKNITVNLTPELAPVPEY